MSDFIYATAKKCTPEFLNPLFKKIYCHLLGLVYHGNKINCPCCHKSFDRFLPFRSVLDEKINGNIVCPSCQSLPRHRALCKLFTENTNKLFFQGIKILHFAPEACVTNYLKRKKVVYKTADVFMNGVDFKIDITNPGIDKNSFDAIICNHVLEHVEDDLKAVSELHRILNKEGWLAITVPIDRNRQKTYEDFSITLKEERTKHFGRSDHCRVYGLDLKERLENVGFKVSIINQYSEEHAIFDGPFAYDVSDIYLCNK